jgi:DNA-binding response OmpR family regulator
MSATSEEPQLDVLLLEDDASSTEAFIQLLNHCGCRVRHASTILDAMPLLREPPQIALLDLMLPDGSGGRILEIIRSRHLKTKVVMLTACRDREKLATVVRQKPDLILTKPVDFIRLLTVVTEVRSNLGLFQTSAPAQPETTDSTPETTAPAPASTDTVTPPAAAA